MRLRKLAGLLEPRSVLAITATAGPEVVMDICNTLTIDHAGEKTTCSMTDAPPNSVKILGYQRKNIEVSAMLLPDHESRLAKVSMES